MNTLQMISILLELTVTILGVLIALEKKKSYGWCIALTFAIYVIYDTSRLLAIAIPEDLLRILFFIATISILFGVWQIYNLKTKKK